MAVIGGVASFYGMPVTVIGQERGKSPKDSMKHNFGMPSPEGYRKALRLMKQAAKFNRPIICFVDTPGAFPGMEAEERGQGEAIARNLFEMSDMKVPILAIITGQGGSGGRTGAGGFQRGMDDGECDLLDPFSGGLCFDSVERCQESQRGGEGHEDDGRGSV